MRNINPLIISSGILNPAELGFINFIYARVLMNNFVFLSAILPSMVVKRPVYGHFWVVADLWQMADKAQITRKLMENVDNSNS